MDERQRRESAATPSRRWPSLRRSTASALSAGACQGNRSHQRRLSRAHRGGAVLHAGDQRAGRARLLAARRSGRLRARAGREDPADPRPARQQPHRLAAQSHPRPARRAAVPDPRCQRNDPRHGPRHDLDRSGAVRKLPRARQGAAHRASWWRWRRFSTSAPRRSCARSCGTRRRQVDRKTLPTPGTILAEITGGKLGGPEHDRAAPERLKATIY